MDDLKIIKKKYGEEMMHLCRELFPTLLETPGLLSKLLEENFYPSKSLCSDIIGNELKEDFKNYLYSLVDVEKKEEIVTKTPQELMKEAGYTLYECQSEEDIETFRKYYRQEEELCTFNGGRLNRCFVFFAVKDNVSEIKREDFSHPQRQDEYGTSVISIQFTRGENNTLSIKNRYNHTVNNPDATFSNDLDNIIPGLTKSFEKNYSLNITSNRQESFEIPGYVRASDGKFYKYNLEIFNIYYCEDNIIIDNFQVIDTYHKEKERYILLDYFILDTKEKKIKLYDEIMGDSFTDGLQGITNIEVIRDREDGSRTIKLSYEQGTPAIIKIDKLGNIISYENNNITEIGCGFLRHNEALKKLRLPSLKTTGNCFLFCNEAITELSLPSLKTVGNGFLRRNEVLKKLSLPSLEQVGDGFLRQNASITELSLPRLEQVGDGFLRQNAAITELGLPRLEQFGNYFLQNNPNYSPKTNGKKR